MENDKPTFKGWVFSRECHFLGKANMWLTKGYVFITELEPDRTYSFYYSFFQQICFDHCAKPNGNCRERKQKMAHGRERVPGLRMSHARNQETVRILMFVRCPRILVRKSSRKPIAVPWRHSTSSGIAWDLRYGAERPSSPPKVILTFFCSYGAAVDICNIQSLYS